MTAVFPRVVEEAVLEEGSGVGVFGLSIFRTFAAGLFWLFIDEYSLPVCFYCFTSYFYRLKNSFWGIAHPAPADIGNVLWLATPVSVLSIDEKS